MFGVTQQGNSVMCHVHNFTPYFYVEVEAKKITLLPADLMQIKKELNNWNKGDECVKSVEIIMKSSVMHYQEKQGTFLKIYTTLPRYVT